ncbi:MAG: hypothetical protein II222_02160 [Paraprevotella sp.]|nr:hypothetical protein [Paraprevotella sp.]
MKTWKLCAYLCTTAAIFTACDESEETSSWGQGIKWTTETSGALILNAGNEYSGIDGEISIFDYATLSCVTGAFSAQNGRSLGLTPNGAIVYGSKIYTAITSSNTIEIINRADMKSAKQLSFTNHTTLTMPRDVVGHDGYVYASFYSGHVARIDTTTFAIDKIVEVGVHPERMTIAGNYIYAPNSGEVLNYDKTVSKINLSTFKVEKTIEVALNPTVLKSDANGRVYALCMGNYNDIPSAIYRIENDGESYTKVAEATMFDIHKSSNTLYAVNAPYGAPKNDYFNIDLNKNDDVITTQEMAIEVEYPAAIAVDPTTQNIILTSYEVIGGYASYSTPGYAKMYKANGTQIARFDVGVGPTFATFFTDSKLTVQ